MQVWTSKERRSAGLLAQQGALVEACPHLELYTVRDIHEAPKSSHTQFHRERKETHILHRFQRCEDGEGRRSWVRRREYGELSGTGENEGLDLYYGHALEHRKMTPSHWYSMVD